MMTTQLSQAIYRAQDAQTEYRAQLYAARANVGSLTALKRAMRELEKAHKDLISAWSAERGVASPFKRSAP